MPQMNIKYGEQEDRKLKRLKKLWGLNSKVDVLIRVLKEFKEVKE